MGGQQSLVSGQSLSYVVSYVKQRGDYSMGASKQNVFTVEGREGQEGKLDGGKYGKHIEGRH